MSRHKKPKELSEREVSRILVDARRLLESVNQASVRTDSEHYRALSEMNAAVYRAAKIITGRDRPWPVSDSAGPC